MRQKGFSFLAVEALGDASKTNAKGYVVASDNSAGYYTSDPEFADFLRRAIAAGYTLISYEARDNSGGYEREAKQAANLNAFLSSHPEAKVIVYAGYGHIRKNRQEPYNHIAKILHAKPDSHPDS